MLTAESIISPPGLLLSKPGKLPREISPGFFLGGKDAGIDFFSNTFSCPFAKFFSCRQFSLGDKPKFFFNFLPHFYFLLIARPQCGQTSNLFIFTFFPHLHFLFLFFAINSPFRHRREKKLIKKGGYKKNSPLRL